MIFRCRVSLPVHTIWKLPFRRITMNIVEQVQSKLKEEIRAAVLKAGLATEEQIPAVVLETPKEKVHGDYSTNMAMQLTRVAKKAPRVIAEALIENIDRSKASIEKIE